MLDKGPKAHLLTLTAKRVNHFERDNERWRKMSSHISVRPVNLAIAAIMAAAALGIGATAAVSAPGGVAISATTQHGAAIPGNNPWV